MDLIGKLTEIIGAVMVALRRKDAPGKVAFGARPAIPEAKKQGIMTLKMPSARGWQGEMRVLSTRVPACGRRLALVLAVQAAVLAAVLAVVVPG